MHNSLGWSVLQDSGISQTKIREQRSKLCILRRDHKLFVVPQRWEDTRLKVEGVESNGWLFPLWIAEVKKGIKIRWRGKKILYPCEKLWDITDYYPISKLKKKRLFLIYSFTCEETILIWRAVICLLIFLNNVEYLRWNQVRTLNDTITVWWHLTAVHLKSTDKLLLGLFKENMFSNFFLFLSLECYPYL